MTTINPRLTTFTAGSDGPWQIEEIRSIKGETLVPATQLQIFSTTPPSLSIPHVWTLCGVTSNERYTSRQEKDQLLAIQPELGRPESTCAALIPIRKNAKWWAMTQDERHQIFAEKSHHTSIGIKYLPAVARKLYHCRDLAEPQPYDFLTWFEFAPTEIDSFDRLLSELRSQPEWSFVERETDIRLRRKDP